MQQIRSAVERMHLKPAPCGSLGAGFLSLVASGGVRIYEPRPEVASTAAFASHGTGIAGYAGLNTSWFGAFELQGRPSDGANLTGTIAHEMDHLLGIEGSPLDYTRHLIIDGVATNETAHSRLCR
jgi:hypothetical protein